MRPTLPLLLAALTGLALAPYPQAPAIGSCAGPYLKDAEHLVLSRGVTTTVEGAFAISNVAAPSSPR